MSNPLLTFTGLPPFSQIKPAHVEPAIDHLLADNRAQIQRLLEPGQSFTWKNLVEPLEELEDRLERAWSPVSHMNSVVNSEELRSAYNACLPKLTHYATELGHNAALFRAYQEVGQQPGLDAAQCKVLDNVLRDFHLSGVDLPPDKKARFKDISQELSQLTSKFEENLLDATNAWSKRIDSADRLAGLPQSALDQAAQAAQQEGEQGWLLTLDFPSYFAVITYADDRTLRHELYRAYSTRASDQATDHPEWDNSNHMERILALRHELARLLGFANYAERSLATKMARSCDQVIHFLEDLARRSRPHAQQDVAELRDYARERHGVQALEAWDIAYYSEKLRHHRYEITQEELKPYFPETRVIPGLFAVVERLFGVKITQVAGGDAWHPDVLFFEIRDDHGDLRGSFYLDLYARRNKRGGAWMGDCITRRFTDTVDQLPVAYLTCNFSPPVGDRPALLTHDEVQTLFHEFGHGLHHMLTRIDYPEVAGINGVAWDAVELPSQFLENWCWEREALGLIAGHYETGAPLPDELYQKMRAARNFQSGMQMVRQLEFALFDFRIHREYDPALGGRIYEILNQVRQQVAVIPAPDFNRFPHGFSHIFAGGYAAGYYSYKWAEVLSADAFSRFEENGIFDQPTGLDFLHHILERGGSEDAMDLFVRFRGREPEIDALLRHSGIAA